MRTGINPLRRISNGSGGNTTGNQLSYSANRAEAPTLQKAVVIDVVCDPSLLTDDYLNEIVQTIDNPELVDVMPINSVIAKIISNQAGMTGGANTILFPFFASHIMLPIKPGEQIYVIYEDYSYMNNKIGFWLSRGCGQLTTEDPNYTHIDRRFDPTMDPSRYTTWQELQRNSQDPEQPTPLSFPNGGNTVSTLTMIPASNNLTDNPYDNLVANSRASKYIAYEPVPRWRKRPAELVFQGSNNAIIMIGNDRNGAISGSIQQNPTDIKEQAGAVDIVAGRGRYVRDPGVDPRSGGGTSNPPGQKNTAPLTAENSRNFNETDKAPYRTNKTENPNEGNPDPIFDAARIYVVQQSRVDENYRLIQVNGEGQRYPEGTLANTQPQENGNLGRSYVVAKGDNIRIVGRKEPNSGINGTVLIIREGEPDTDLAFIHLNNEGKMQLESPKIYIGKATPEQEPYIKYTVYKETIETLQGEIDSIKDYLKQVLGTGGTITTAFQASNAIPYSPIASLVGSAPSVQANTENLAVQIEQKSSDVTGRLVDIVKSTKIFGE